MVFNSIIEESLDKKLGIKDNIGKSSANVYIYNDMVLKVCECSQEAENERNMLIWLQGKLPVPEIIEFEQVNGYSCLLMRRCLGNMACDKSFMAQPELLCTLLTNTLRQMWSIDCKGCPTDCSLSQKLCIAEYNVSNGLVDVNDAEPETFGENGFSSPERLLYWLLENKPDEEPVFSHGDFCLPNIFFDKNGLSGLIDLGRAGIADRWCDIALCYRSLKDNYSGRYSGQIQTYFEEAHIFDALELRPDWDKLRYYVLLDELF